MTQTLTPVERLFDFFRAAGMDPTPKEVAEMLWIAARLPSTSGEMMPKPPVPIPGPPPEIPPPLFQPPSRQTQSPTRSESFGPAVTTASVTAAAALYPMQASTDREGTAARLIRSPGASALPGGLEIGRSLRPLKRRVPSRSNFVLDEAATVHRVADTGDWTPVLNPAQERWLNVVLLVDESSSMVIWQRTIAEFRSLLERQGAFRKVELLGFRSSSGTTSVQIYNGIGPTANRSQFRRPSELIDPLGRRLIVVVSDCVSPIWHNGLMATLLSRWGESGLATVAQVLPKRLWIRTGLRNCPGIFLRSPGPGAPNSQFEIEWTNYRPKKESLLSRGTPVPVVSLEPQFLGYWSRALAGHSNLWIPGVFAPAAPGPSSGTLASAATAATSRADQVVNLFYGTASPPARILACALAAVPLTLPLMRLVQRTILPDSHLVHLAEVWLSGLIDRPAEIDHKKPADDVEYHFVTGVRELLLKNLRLSDTLHILKTISNYVGERLGQPLDFDALIADPQASGNLHIAEGYRSFAQVAATALRRYGGQYADLSQRLEGSLYGEAFQTTERSIESKIDQTSARKTKHPRPGNRAATIRALLVGINEHGSSDIPALAGAANDVSITRDWLQRCGVPVSNIVTLLDQQATKRAIVDAWHQAAAQMADDDQFFFHFSGRDLPITSSDPDEADGLEETLVAYDSNPPDRATLLTHQELAELAAEVEQRGGQAVLVLDSCRSASGLLCRRALGATLVFAGAAEAELAGEMRFGVRYYGAFSYFLAEAMQQYRPGMTWLDAYDVVLAKLRSQGSKQTPQLIGAGDREIFGSERRPVSAYLLVTKSDEREIEVNAPAALNLGFGDTGANLAIYPPGSSMSLEKPISFAHVTRITKNGVAATGHGNVTVPVASRVKVLNYGDAQPVIRVSMDEELLKWYQVSPFPTLVHTQPPSDEEVDFSVSRISNTAFGVNDREGRLIWRELDSSVDAVPMAHATNIQGFLEHLAIFLRTLALANLDVGSDLAGKIELEFLTPASGETITLAEPELLKFQLRNRSSTDLYISVWMLDEQLGIQRIFPATTSCALFGADRELQLAVAVHSYAPDAPSVRRSLKVFASTEPADLSILALQPLDQPVDLFDLAPWSPQTIARTASKRTRKKATKKTSAATTSETAKDDYVAGGPVALTAKLWRAGMTLRIRFLKGNAQLQEKIKKTVLEWTKYANLHFEFVTQGDAELRIDFARDGSSWSYMGTDSLQIPKGTATINLGSIDLTTAEEEFRRVVLHEFGHALGLAAAQSSPVANIPWNKKATYEYYEKMGWDRATVDRNVFAKHTPSEVMYGPPDANSIMYHPIPSELTDGKIEIVLASELSSGDQRFIAQVYPPSVTR